MNRIYADGKKSELHLIFFALSEFIPFIRGLISAIFNV